jgi:hypothetical protein
LIKTSTSKPSKYGNGASSAGGSKDLGKGMWNIWLSWGWSHDMVRWPDVFDPGTGILDRFVMLVILGWIGLFVPIAVGITISISKALEGWPLLPIPQCTEDDTMNVNVMCCLRCVEQRVAKHHFMVACCVLSSSLPCCGVSYHIISFLIPNPQHTVIVVYV